MISFFVEGTPKAQARPRAFIRGGKAAVYNPSTAEYWKQAVFLEAHKHAGSMFDFPVTLKLAFFFKRPKSHLRKSGEIKKDAPWRHTQRPDLDNLEKAVMDAMTSSGIWIDDAQVCEKFSSKQWSCARSGVEIRVEAKSK